MKKQRIVKAMFALSALGLLLLGPARTLAQETAEELYQAGLYQEEVQGNLERAIDLYGRILIRFPDNRAVGARAQLHIGLCYEKLGQQEAQQAYRRVIAEFPEHAAEVAVARDRLAEIQRSLEELNRQPTFRRIQISSRPHNGVLAPDGSHLAFVADGSVWMVPLQGDVGPDIAGKPIRIRSVQGIWDYWSQLAWSADGEWIAVNAGGEDLDAVHVIPVSGGQLRTIPMPARGGHAWSYRLSLSPDGQRLAYSAMEPGGGQEVRYIYTASTRGGEARRMASVWGRLPAFSPDGELIAFVGYGSRVDRPGDTFEGRYEGDLWLVPSAGGPPVRLTQVDGKLRGPVWSPDGRYIAAHHEPLRGNDSDEIWVYPLSQDASSVGAPTKILLPRSSGHILAGWTPENGLGVFIESETRNALYTVPISGGRAVQVTPEGRLYYPRWSPDGGRIYLRWFFGEGDTGRVTDLLAGHESTVYVPATGGEFVEIPMRNERGGLGPVIPGGGLNLSPDGKRIVISAAQHPWDPEEGLDLWTIPVEGGSPTRLTMDASSESYPCWSPDGQWIAFKEDAIGRPGDDRYQAIYLVPAEGGEFRQITPRGEEVGGGAIAVSPDGRRIAFFSGDAIKTVTVDGGQVEVLVRGVSSGRHGQLAYSPDGSKIAHSAEGKIWITPLDRGVPEVLRTGLPEAAGLYDFSWSPDGEQMVFEAGIGGEAEFWLISDFLPREAGR
jgi:Tol biopolymer transport system component